MRSVDRRGLDVPCWWSRLCVQTFRLCTFISVLMCFGAEGGATLACEAPTAEAWMYLLVEPLMAEAFERLPSIGCAVTIACGGGGQPTDFLHEIAPAAAARLPKGRLKRCVWSRSDAHDANAACRFSGSNDGVVLCIRRLTVLGSICGSASSQV